ncbi:MAG: 30S ribosomal protein THX [Saprospiraceae bacterium]|nr:30S ribosomal protein THX [Saprospiraceae bacterium]
MGRGDKRTFRGKLWRGSHGKTRPKKKALRKVVPAKPTAEA